nr:DUF2169 domain-containing protein [Pseudenhygromyxa sp. WMMC2535]
MQNATPLLASCFVSVDPEGHERAVVVVKGTFGIPRAGGAPALVDEHERDPFVHADTFTGEPGRSAMVRECEFVPFKPRCDVLLLGAAHAPPGQTVEKIEVALRVGALTKHFEVVGDRYWTMGALGLRPSKSAKPFSRLELSYDVAYGGSDTKGAYGPNPVGRGYFDGTPRREQLGQPVPNSQESGCPITSPSGRYRPMSFGPVGRNFADRLELAGTYDDAWLEHVFPGLPEDFRHGYFQSAPLDQQMSYPEGGEPVQLLNLSAEPIPPFVLPTLDLPVCFVMADNTETTLAPVLDTIVIEPDRGRLQLLWRTSILLSQGPDGLREIAVGRMPTGWRRARASGKRYFRSLAELVDAMEGTR